MSMMTNMMSLPMKRGKDKHSKIKNIPILLDRGEEQSKEVILNKLKMIKVTNIIIMSKVLHLNHRPKAIKNKLISPLYSIMGLETPDLMLTLKVKAKGNA